MLILADENIPLVDSFFEGLGTLERIDGRHLDSSRARQADVLLVRSVTRIDRTLLEGGRTRFVASATIGTDHIDREYLASRGIDFASAPGCNADSVVDYVLSALFNLAVREGVTLSSRTLGIVGVGNVGGRLLARLQALGLRVLCCDPPRAEQGEGSFVGIDELLARCDLVCLHTPLTLEGPHATRHLLDAGRLAALRPGCWLLNAGRGPVIDNGALADLLPKRPDLRVVLDVWEREPGFDLRLARQITLGTPHIAGHSIEGKARGTEMIYQALCRHLGRPPVHSLEDLLTPPAVLEVRIGRGTSDLPRQLINLCYDLRNDHDRFQSLLSLPDAARLTAFDRLRRNYPERREFSSLRLTGVDAGSELGRTLVALGFALQTP